MAFERYTKTLKKRKPTVTIWNRGQIGFSKAAKRSFDMENFRYAILFYDCDTHRIGIQLTNIETEDGAMRLCHSQNVSYINAIRFLNSYGIKHREGKKYALTYNHAEALLVAELDNPIIKNGVSHD